MERTSQNANGGYRFSRIALRAMSVAAGVACVSMGYLGVFLPFDRYIKPSFWHTASGEVVSIEQHPVGKTYTFASEIGFRYSSHGYKRTAYCEYFGPLSDTHKLSGVFVVGSQHVIRYNPQDFSEIRAPFVWTLESVAYVLPLVLSISCGFVCWWFWISG